MGDEYLYLNSLNKIQFAYENLIKDESSIKRNYINRRNGSSCKAYIISISIIAGVAVICGLIGF